MVDLDQPSSSKQEVSLTPMSTAPSIGAAPNDTSLSSLESSSESGIDVLARSPEPIVSGTGQVIVAALLEHWVRAKFEHLPSAEQERLYQEVAHSLGSYGIGFGQATSEASSSTRQKYLDGAEKIASQILKDKPLIQPAASENSLVPSGTRLARQADTANTADLTNRRRATLQRSLSLPPERVSPAKLQIENAGNLQLSTVSKSSRLIEDYDQHELIGKGGFGVVYRAVNKLDGGVYALKVIKLKSSPTDALEHQKVLKEIRTLARLDHENIVRYFHSWLDHDEATTPSPNFLNMGLNAISEEGSGSLDNFCGPTKTNPNDPVIEFGLDSTDLSQDESSSPTSSSDSSEDSDGSSGNAVKEVEGDSDDDGSEDGDSIFAGGSTSAVGALVRAAKTPFDGPISTLYIAMSLHPLSLADYLSISARIPKPAGKHCYCAAASLRIIQGIVAGVAYLHDQGVIHRDIKPANVFLNLGSRLDCCEEPGIAVVPKIGDFGLVAHIDSQEPSSVGQTHVGTAFYSSPEGGNDPKVDIWALGVILLELVYKFGTLAERAFVLTALTDPQSPKRRIPADLAKDQYLKTIDIITGCCDFEAAKRPSAHELGVAVQSAMEDLDQEPLGKKGSPLQDDIEVGESISD